MAPSNVDKQRPDPRASLLPLTGSDEIIQPRPVYKSTFFSQKNPLRIAILFYSSVALYVVFGFIDQRVWHGLFRGKPTIGETFFHNITSPRGLCISPTGHDVSHSGYIGLKGDTEQNPKRSFFWFFEAEKSYKEAPLILAFGGGPGTSGMMYATFGQSPCVITSNGTVPNPHRWTEHFNLIILDHPVNVGFSYGTHVNNSHQAALDVYDFLQKFYKIFPDFLRSPFILAGGSYGGIYVPNIASVIHKQNLAIRAGHGQPGAKHINLHSMMLSNPVVDPLSHFAWLPYYRCEVSKIYNATTCQDVYAKLPECIEAVSLAYRQPTVKHRVDALYTCGEKLEGDTQGHSIEDVRVKCETDPDDSPVKCHPQFKWVNDFFTAESTRRELGIPDFVNFTSLSMDVNKEFEKSGDFVQPHSLLYEPLLKDGIKLLHYVGAQDANCARPGVLSALKLIESPFQDDFIIAADVQWPANTSGISTVRAVGPGAGNFTYFLIQNAGHFVVNNQRALVKQIVERWIMNEPWFA